LSQAVKVHAMLTAQMIYNSFFMIRFDLE